MLRKKIEKILKIPFNPINPYQNYSGLRKYVKRIGEWENRGMSNNSPFYPFATSPFLLNFFAKSISLSINVNK